MLHPPEDGQSLRVPGVLLGVPDQRLRLEGAGDLFGARGRSQVEGVKALDIGEERVGVGDLHVVAVHPSVTGVNQ